MTTRGLQSVYNQIRSRISIKGPITLAEYMKLALTQVPMHLGNGRKHETENSGYYMKKDVFGQQGDFITSPEISQMFGEMIAVWGIQTWMQVGGPKKFNIVELGPGRGTLAKDILRVFRQFKHLTGNDVSLHLVEISPFLASVQHQTLCPVIYNEDSVDSIGEQSKSTHNNTAGSRTENSNEQGDLHGKNGFYREAIASESGYPVYWYRDIKDVPKEFNFYIAHEFLDVLPVHKLQKVDGRWREVLVDIENGRNEDKEKFRFVISRHETPVIKLLRSHYEHILKDSRSHIEVSIEAFQILEEMATRLDKDGGLSIIVDYGHVGTKEDTFRGFFQHALHDPLINPGTVDLTSDVDFSFIKKILAEKLLICGPITQSTFLSRVGMNTRLETLLDKCHSEEEKQNLLMSYKMLTEDMGSRFLFMSLLPKVLEQYLPKLKIACFHE